MLIVIYKGILRLTIPLSGNSIYLVHCVPAPVIGMSLRNRMVSPMFKLVGFLLVVYLGLVGFGVLLVDLPYISRFKLAWVFSPLLLELR